MVGHLADHDGTFDASILGDLADRSLEGAADNVDAGLLVLVVAFDLQGFRCPQQSDTSVSVDPPTLITATPPASFASRSCSFSLS
jgi:hypothetical protein